MLNKLKVIVHTHHFVVTSISPRTREAVEKFARRNVQYGFIKVGRQFRRAPVKVFAAATKDRNEYSFHINQLKEFKDALKLAFLTEEQVDYSEAPLVATAKIELPIFEQWTVREDQEPVVEYLINEEGPRQKFVNLQTGKGKSFCTMKSCSELQALQMIVVKPMYIDKWVIDIKKTYDIENDEILCVRGSANLKALLELATMGELKAKVIIISNKTLQNWIKLYEQFRDNVADMGYACTPRQLFQHLGVGVRVIDEVHQDFHLNFKIDLYTHVERGISLSATLLSDDEFMNRMYEIAYPKQHRYNGGAFDRYIKAKALLYRINNPDGFKCVDWATKRYSHNIFEQSIMKSPPRLANYTKLIIQAIESSYEKDYKDGNRLIIFCASIAFCTYLTNELKKRYPNRDVRRYVEEDPYEDLMEADIRVTTLLSAGTAVDIPNLKTTILTVAVSSSQSNVQGLGRLRKLHDGQEPEFIYFVAENIPKHVEYHVKKRDLLKPRTKSYSEEVAFAVI